MRLSEAQKKAAKLIKKLAQEKINETAPCSEGLEILFLIRDGLMDAPLDPYKLEEYDNCYGVDLEN